MDTRDGLTDNVPSVLVSQKLDNGSHMSKHVYCFRTKVIPAFKLKRNNTPFSH